MNWQHLVTTAILLLFCVGAVALVWLVGAFIAWDLYWLGWKGYRIMFVVFCGIIVISMMCKEVREDEGTASGPTAPPPPKPRH